MRKVIKFSKAYLFFTIFSATFIAVGIFGLFTKGLNYGIDFQAGFIEKVRIAPTALTLQYQGSQSVVVSQSPTGIDIVVTSVGDNNKTFNFPYTKYPTVSSFAADAAKIDGVSVQVIAPPDSPLKDVFPDSNTSTRLAATPYRYHYVPSDAKVLTSDDIRKVVSMFPDAAVQVLGAPRDRFFQIRLKDDGSDPQASTNLRTKLNQAFISAYGEDSVAIISTDFVGSRFSKSLASQSAWLVLLTISLIWGYCAIRFRWDFAMGATFAIAHDAMTMITFIVWTRMQFNSTTIAAILTILGYSINDTVVVFDRLRKNMKIHPEMTITEHLNLSQTEMLARSIITTATTMLAVLSLFIFTTGDMKDFAAALLFGMASGVYSTIIIASAFINFVGRFRKDKGMHKEKPALKVVTSGEIV
jgi:preprotein translocase subunit SecF